MRQEIQEIQDEQLLIHAEIDEFSKLKSLCHEQTIKLALCQKLLTPLVVKKVSTSNQSAAQIFNVLTSSPPSSVKEHQYNFFKRLMSVKPSSLTSKQVQECGHLLAQTQKNASSASAEHLVNKWVRLLLEVTKTHHKLAEGKGKHEMLQQMAKQLPQEIQRRQDQIKQIEGGSAQTNGMRRHRTSHFL